MSQTLSVASSGLSLVSGIGQRSALRAEARSLERQAEVEELRGKQISAKNTSELVESLGAIEAIRAGRGVSNNSPSALASRSDLIDEAFAANNAQVLTSNLRRDDLRTTAAGRRSAGTLALLSGVGQGTASLVAALAPSPPGAS